jgi:hypothetical protein
MDLKTKFHKDMVNIYKRAKEEAHYNATRFLQMVSEDGGLNAAKKLIAHEDDSLGFEKLWELNKLELTVEVLVLKDEYHSLFSEEEQEKCRIKLIKHGYESF